MTDKYVRVKRVDVVSLIENDCPVKMLKDFVGHFCKPEHGYDTSHIVNYGSPGKLFSFYNRYPEFVQWLLDNGYIKKAVPLEKTYRVGDTFLLDAGSESGSVYRISRNCDGKYGLVCLHGTGNWYNLASYIGAIPIYIEAETEITVAEFKKMTAGIDVDEFKPVKTTHTFE